MDNEGSACHSVLQITSEYKPGNKTFRALGNYQNNGPWYDWVMFRWEKSTGVTRRHECCVEYLDNPLVAQIYDYTPGQIVTCVVCPVQNETELSQILAVVKTCGFLHNKGSIFSTIWQQEFDNSLQTLPSFVLLNVDCIVCHYLMLPTNIEHSCYQGIIWHCECWTNMRTRTKRTRGTENPDAFMRLNMRLVRVAHSSFITQVERQLCIVNQGYTIVTKQQ
jgi:hypothetical protein